MAYFCRVLSWPSPFPHITFQVWFGLFFFLHCSFLPTHFLTEPRMSFYQKFSSLIVELRLFWPHNTFFFFFLQKSFNFFLPYFFFSWTTQFIVLLTLEISIGLLLLVTLFCMSIFHLNRTTFPVSLKL